MSGTVSGSVTAIAITSLTPDVNLTVTATTGSLSGWLVCYKGDTLEVACSAPQATVSFQPPPCGRYTAFVKHDGAVVPGITADINLEATAPSRCATRVLGGTALRVGNVEMFGSSPMHVRANSGAWRLATGNEPFLDDASNLLALGNRFSVTKGKTIYSSLDGVAWSGAFTTTDEIIASGATSARAYWVTGVVSGALYTGLKVVTTANFTSFNTITVSGLSSVSTSGAVFGATQMNAREVLTWSPRATVFMLAFTSTDGLTFSQLPNPCAVNAFANTLHAPTVGAGFAQLECDAGAGTFELTNGTAWVNTTPAVTAYLRAGKDAGEALLGYSPGKFQPHVRLLSGGGWSLNSSQYLGGYIQSLSIDSVADASDQTVTLDSGAVVKSTDFGANWSFNKAGERINSVAVSAKYAVAVSGAGVYWVSDADNPMVWTPHTTDILFNVKGVTAVDSSVLIATTEYFNFATLVNESTIVRSADYGLSWDEVESNDFVLNAVRGGGGTASAPTGYVLACEPASNECIRSNATGVNPGQGWDPAFARIGSETPFTPIWIAGYNGGFIAIDAANKALWSPDGQTWSLSLGSNLQPGNAVDTHVYVSRAGTSIDVFAIDGSISLVQTNLHEYGHAVKDGSRTLFYGESGMVYVATDGINFTARATMRQKQVALTRGSTAMLGAKVILHNSKGEVFVTTPPP